MKKLLLLSCSFLIICGFAGSAIAGKIVLANDEWTLSSTGFSGSNDPATFATNVASWFTDGSTGNFLAYSSNFGLTGSQLNTAMTSAGYGWNVTTSVTFDLATLATYDGVFLAGNPADNNVLIDYVNSGGNVYLAGGTGWGGAANEAARWNTFLNNFGLGFGSTYNGVSGNIAISDSHAIFNGVDHLYQNNGNDALDIIPNNFQAEVLVSQNGHGLYAVYDSSAPVPIPSTLLLLGTGLLGIIGATKKKFNT